MTRITIPRRNLVATGAFALASAVDLPGLTRTGALGQHDSTNEEIIREWYAAWEKKDLGTFNMLLADNFTFTSAAGDDHISKSAFKAQCWETQIDFIERFDLERVFGRGDEAVVMYVCRTRNGKSLRNVEYLRLRDDKVEAIECYFGEQSSFPSAVSTGRK